MCLFVNPCVIMDRATMPGHKLAPKIFVTLPLRKEKGKRLEVIFGLALSDGRKSKLKKNCDSHILAEHPGRLLGLWPSPNSFG